MTLENARGESIGDNIYALDEATEQKGPNVGRETICRDGDDPEMKSAALLVLMTALENGRIPQWGAVSSTALTALQKQHTRLAVGRAFFDTSDRD